MFDQLLTIDSMATLLTLTGLEVVLGIDNIVFISLMADKLPKSQQAFARQGGLLLALILRVTLLLFASTIAKLQNPLFAVFGMDFSGRMLLFIFGGLFLVYKGWHEFSEMFAPPEAPNIKTPTAKKQKFLRVIFQIGMIDLVLSFDSVITAIGLTDNLTIIIIAITIAIIAMVVLAGKMSAFLKKYPSIKVIAISIVMLVGAYLTLKGFNVIISKNYLNFAIFFSIIVEVLNIRYRQHLSKVKEQ